jgi:hypothetical protein
MDGMKDFRKQARFGPLITWIPMMRFWNDLIKASATVRSMI